MRICAVLDEPMDAMMIMDTDELKKVQVNAGTSELEENPNPDKQYKEDWFTLKSFPTVGASQSWWKKHATIYYLP